MRRMNCQIQIWNHLRIFMLLMTNNDEYDKMLSMIKQPPLISDPLEEFDTSDASLMELDGHKLKEEDYCYYLQLVLFFDECQRKIVLKKFSGPTHRGIDGKVVSCEGNKLGARSRKFAKRAIYKYNSVAKGGKLTLKKPIKVTTDLEYYYMTFSAINRNTGDSGIYQAALISLGPPYPYELGLFRDWSNDKVLAILSIKGAEEELEAIRNGKMTGRSRSLESNQDMMSSFHTL